MRWRRSPVVAEFDPVELLRVLNRHQVRFVLIGGIAGRLQGAPLLTTDVDVTPASDRANLENLCGALGELRARLRTTAEPDGVDFPIDPEMLATAQSWTLVTRSGDLDLVFMPAGSRGYPDLVRDAVQLPVVSDGSVLVLVASLADVIRTKEAAGRAKDRAALPLLRQALEELADWQPIGEA